MLTLIKNIEGQYITETIGSVSLSNNIIGQIQQEDYVNLNGFVAYLQNLTKTEVTEALTKPLSVCPLKRYNREILTLDIDY